MTDWQEHWLVGVDRWLEVQRDWWTTIMHALDAPPTEAPAQTAAPDRAALEDLQQRITQALRQAADQIALAQAEILRRALEDGLRAGSDEFVRRWADAQRDILRSVMAVASTGADAGAADPERTGGQVIESLQDAAERLVRSQADWAKAWSTAHPGVEDGPEPAGG